MAFVETTVDERRPAVVVANPSSDLGAFKRLWNVEPHHEPGAKLVAPTVRCLPALRKELLVGRLSSCQRALDLAPAQGAQH